MFPGKLPGHAALPGGLIEAVQSVCQGLAGAGDVDALVAGTGRAEVGAVVQVEHALVGEEHLHVCVAHAEAAEVAPDQVGALQLGDHNSGEVLGEEVADILVVALDDLDELFQPPGAVAVGGLVGHGAEALDVHEGLEAHLLLELARTSSLGMMMLA